MSGLGVRSGGGVHGFTLTVYPAVPGSASDERLRLLASWAATEQIQDLAKAYRP